MKAAGTISMGKRVLFGVGGFFLAIGLARAGEFAFGADLSFLKQAEDHGKVFKDGTNAMPGLQIFREHGYNWIRLRIFVEPVGQNLPNNLQYTLDMARAAKKLGYKFLLDLHYASTWADPGQQPTPKQWEAMSHAERVEAVFAYTRDTIAALRDGGALPDMVQIGNEVANGMLWPDGRLPNNWDHFAAYVHAGVNGVDAGHGNGPRPKIMIHVDLGGQMQKTKWFFDKFNSYDIPYDVIGFSYYPRWQGTLMDLRENLAFTAHEYGKDIIVVETGYNWKPIPATSDRPQPFPTTPEGQREFLDEVTRIVMEVPGGRGKGIFWWEPAASRNIDMRSFFDDDGNSLPVLTVFDKYTRPSLNDK
jgi:arabinogalactan endo-1,4-beta-galactosidase